jgi:hypothetical protein
MEAGLLSGAGNPTPEDFDVILRGYSSALAYPAAMYPAELYAAYPDAKFILVRLVRPPPILDIDARCRPPETPPSGK